VSANRHYVLESIEAIDKRDVALLTWRGIPRDVYSAEAAEFSTFIHANHFVTFYRLTGGGRLRSVLSSQ
jgi:hypothetical protein